MYIIIYQRIFFNYIRKAVRRREKRQSGYRPDVRDVWKDHGRDHVVSR